MEEIERVQLESERRMRKKHMSEMLNEPFERKLGRSNALVDEFVDVFSIDSVYVSTSGGKDSACVSRLFMNKYPGIKHIMFNTGLEYKATISTARKQGAKIIPPSISWADSCEKHGYPMVSKQVSKRVHDIGNTPIGTAIALFNDTYRMADKWLHLTDKEFVDFPVSGYCCTEFKKKPSHGMKGMNPIIGTRISESRDRQNAWKKSGCNSYSADGKHGISRPISLWLDDDVNRYVRDENVELSELYTQYEQKRTGCKICPYGAQIDGSRFDLLRKLEPRTYEYYIYNTRLGYILAITGVDIVSDDRYMRMKKKYDERIRQWHDEHKGNDRYFSYKCELAMSYYSVSEMMDAIKHIQDKGSRLEWTAEEIHNKMKEILLKKEKQL